MEKAYYQAPEYLAHVYTITDPNASYDFSDVLLAQDTRDGTLWAAHDSGCSCPSPFEQHTFPTDFTQVRTEEDLRSFIAGVGTDYRPEDIDSAVAVLKGEGK